MQAILVALLLGLGSARREAPPIWDTKLEWPWHWGSSTNCSGKDIVGGFMDAYGYDHIHSCGGEFKASFDELDEALKKFETKSLKDKYEAMKDILVAIKDIPLALLSCHMATTGLIHIMQLLEDVSNPQFFTRHNVLNLFLNAGEAHQRFSAAVVAWESKDCRTAGKDLAEAIQIILAEPSFPGNVNNTGNTTLCGKKGAVADLLRQRKPTLYYEYLAEANGGAAGDAEISVKVAAGIAEGFAMTLDGDACLAASGHVALDVAGLVKDLTTGNAFGAVLKVVDGLEELYPIYKDCKAEKGKLKELLSALNILRHPKKFIYDVGHLFKVDGIDISLEMASAIYAFEGEDWNRVGVELGKMLAKLVLESASDSPNSTNAQWVDLLADPV